MWKLDCSLAMILFIMTSLPYTTSSHGYGQLLGPYVAEVLIYVEWSAITAWKNATGNQDYLMLMSEEIRSIMIEVNKIYESLRPYNVYLQFEIQDIQFKHYNVLHKDSNGRLVDSPTAIGHFQEEMRLVYQGRKYDLAILYTGSTNLVRHGVLGVAWTHSICGHNALGIVEFYSQYSDAIITAHEIGHIVGSNHDGTGQFGQSCNRDTGHFVMSAVLNDRSPTRVLFSPCSAGSIREHIQGKLKNNNCLERGNTDTIYIKGPRYESLVSPDELCRREAGAQSYFNRKRQGQICSLLYCASRSPPSSLTWTEISPPEGLRCGKNKRCKMGICTWAVDGDPTVSDTCPFGDQPRLEPGPLSDCSQMTADLCSNGWGSTCCETCSGRQESLMSPDELCRRAVGPRSYMYRKMQGHICQRVYCVDMILRTGFTWNQIAPPEGLRCGKNKRCKMGTCTWAVDGDPTVSDTCPFGDQPRLEPGPLSDCSQMTADLCSNGWGPLCCETCSKFSLFSVSPSTSDLSPDGLCQRYVGPHSYMDRQEQTKVASVCAQVVCWVARGRWSHIPLPEGMACGKNRRCFQGRCQLSSTGDPGMSDLCPFGDQPWLGGNRQKTCRALVRRYGCHFKSLRKRCCKSCQSLKS